MNSIPMFNSPKKDVSPNGITDIIKSVGANKTIGAMANTGPSASFGIVFSFIIDFMTSAND